jgi:hypothetical protein
MQRQSMSLSFLANAQRACISKVALKISDNFRMKHKLLKQAFAITKSGLIYDKEYKSTLVRNK